MAPCQEFPDYLGLFVHCISWVLTLISLFFSDSDGSEELLARTQHNGGGNFVRFAAPTSVVQCSCDDGTF